MTIHTGKDLLIDMIVTALRLQTGLPIGPPRGDRTDQSNRLRHILLCSPEEIRQVIHQLHVLNYVEWSRCCGARLWRWANG